MTYEFTLVLRDVDAMSDVIADALYESGCADATPFSGDGSSGLAFARRAATLEDAIRSAVSNVKAAGFEIARVELQPETLASA